MKKPLATPTSDGPTGEDLIAENERQAQTTATVKTLVETTTLPRNPPGAPITGGAVDMTEVHRRERDHPDRYSTHSQAVDDVSVDQASAQGAPKWFNQTLADSLDAEKRAEEATAQAAEMRRAGIVLQNQWESLLRELDRLQERLANGVSLCVALDDREATLLDQFETHFANSDYGWPAMSAGVLDIRAKRPLWLAALEKLRIRVRDHVAKVRQFVTDNGLPAELLEGLPSDA